MPSQLLSPASHILSNIGIGAETASTLIIVPRCARVPNFPQLPSALPTLSRSCTGIECLARHHIRICRPSSHANRRPVSFLCRRRSVPSRHISRGVVTTRGPLRRNGMWDLRRTCWLLLGGRRALHRKNYNNSLASTDELELTSVVSRDKAETDVKS